MIYKVAISSCVLGLVRIQSGKAYLGNVIMKPLGTLFTSNATKVSSIIASHVLQNIVHLLGRDLRKQGLHNSLV